MPSQAPTPSEIPLPDRASSSPEMNWRPKAKEVLREGASFSVDTSQTIGELSSIGLDASQFGEGSGVIAKIEDGVDRAKYDEENGIDLSVVRIVHPAGTEELYLVSDKVGEDGQVTKEFTKVHTGVEFTVGRARPEDVQENQFIDGATLTGNSFSDGISRKHFTIEHDYISGSVEIKGLGVNGTKVEAYKQQPTRKEAASATIAMAGGSVEEVDESAPQTSSKPKRLITSVPRTPDELAEFQQAEAAAKEAERLELIRPNLDQLSQQIKDAEQELNELKSGLSESEAMAVWKVVAAIENYDEARRAGNHHVADMENRNYGTFRNELPTQRARDAVTPYRNLFQKLNRMRRQQTRLLDPKQ